MHKDDWGINSPRYVNQQQYSYHMKKDIWGAKLYKQGLISYREISYFVLPKGRQDTMYMRTIICVFCFNIFKYFWV